MGTSVPLVLNGKFLSERSFILAKGSVETSGFTMFKCMYHVYYFL